MRKKEFCQSFEEQVEKTIKNHGLIKKNDKVMVAVSGGKDSTTALYVLKKLGYNVEGIIIDQLLGEYSRQNLDNIKKFCKKNNIHLHVVHMRDEYGCSVCYMTSVLDEKGIHMNTCTVCGVIRRAVLNKKGRELKASVIATGHNLDDEVQTVFMNYIRGDISRCARLGPLAGIVTDKRFIPRIKPLYFNIENDIEQYSKIKEFPVIYAPCPCSADSTRSNIKKILNEWEKKHPGAKKKMLEGFMALKPKLTGKQKNGSIGECIVCGEPASNKVCRVCNIIENIKAK